MIAGSAINDVRPSFRHVMGAEIVEVRNQAINAIMRDGAPPGPTLEQAAAQINRLLAEAQP